MADSPALPHHPLRLTDLSERRPTAFSLAPDATGRAAIAEALGLDGLRKLAFTGEISFAAAGAWVLDGRLGATVVQPCVVTLAPVATRIDVDVRRRFVADLPEPREDEAEMPEDDTLEPLGAAIDPAAVMIEALALNLPLYPRAQDAGLGEAVFAGPGVTPLRDEDAKPFAGLAGRLADKPGREDD